MFQILLEYNVAVKFEIGLEIEVKN